MPTSTEIPCCAINGADLVLLPPEAWGIVVNFFFNHLWNFYKYNQSHNHGLSTTRIIAGGLLCGRCRGSWRAGLSFWPGSPSSSQIVERIDIISLTPFLIFCSTDLINLISREGYQQGGGRLWRQVGNYSIIQGGDASKNQKSHNALQLTVSTLLEHNVKL